MTRAVQRARLWLRRVFTPLLPAVVLALLGAQAAAAPLRIVAIGASNTSGIYISKDETYPALLQKLLKEHGVDAEVTNSGVPFDTTAAMLRRIDSDVPKGIDIVILQPGANDLRFFGTKEQRAANIAEMERRLRARSIKVIVYDEDVPWRYYALDFIHFNREGHAMIAAALLPRVLALIGKGQGRAGAKLHRP
jgi:acyl-CoA thioesterase-1